MAVRLVRHEGGLPPGRVLTVPSEVLRIDSLGNGVGGVARSPGRPVTFVRGALPGEKVSCEVVQEKSSYRIARLLEVLEPSPSRVDPPCPLFPECGGCSLQHLAYDRQVEQKRGWVEAALRKCVDPSAFRDTVRSPFQLGYRNRVSFDVVDGRTGLHRYRGEAFPVDDCLLLGDRGRDVLSGLKAVDLSFCSRVCVRSSIGTSSDALEFSECTRPASIPMPGVGTACETADGWVVTGCWGYAEELSGTRYSIPPSGFFQVNTRAAELLAAAVLRATAGASSVLDLYGGVGTFAIPLAKAGARVTSVDWNGPSATAGASSAAAAGVGERVEFVTLDSGRFLAAETASGASWDVVVLDPPRGGLEGGTSRLLIRLSPPRLVYVSCDPQTLGRDLGVLEDAYDAVEVIPFDLFPQTDSVETVTVLERRKGGVSQ